jgi:hypothetical protein
MVPWSIGNDSSCAVVVFVFCRKEAGVAMDGSFLIRCVYADEMTYRLLLAAEKILGKYSLLGPGLSM